MKGLKIVHTGDGKGKSTAAFGLALRAFGNNLRVLILQFIKGQKKSGELIACEKLGIEVRQLGLGFSIGDEDQNRHRIAAENAVETARNEISSKNWDMIMLDEINYAVKFSLISKEDLLGLLDLNSEVHLVFTGRDACSELIDRADLVTEMTLIKHPYQQGIKAQIGIEF